jgi:PAS domain S-box-containing protein
MPSEQPTPVSTLRPTPTGDGAHWGVNVTIDRAPVGIGHFDETGRFLFVNPFLCTLLGMSHDELLRRTFQETTFPDDLPRCLEMTEQLAAGAIPRYTLEKRFVRPDGSSVYTRVIVTAVRHADDRLAFFLGIVEDLSEQWTIEEARRAAEARLNLALEASGTGIYRYDFRAQALDWSNNLSRVFGFTDDAQLYPLDRLLGAIHSDDLPTVRASYQRSAEFGDDFDEEFRITRADGADRWVCDRARMTLGDDGKPWYLTGACTDITERKEAEVNLRRSEQHFRALSNNIPQLAWIADANGARTWFNDRWYQYTGTSPADMLGFGWERVHRPEHVEAVRHGQRETFARASEWEATVELRGADGQFRWFLTRAVPMHTAHERVLQWMGTDTDVTDQRAAEQSVRESLERERNAHERTERAVRVRDEVMAIVAHDLRNPVHTILMSAGAVAELPLSDAERTQQLSLIQRSARSMDHLIRDLLDVARMETGTLSVTRSREDVGDVIDEAMNAIRSRAESQGLTLATEIPNDMPPISVDRERIVRVLGNLLGNAVKFTRHGGRVCVLAHPAGDFVQLSVADTGDGIPSEHLERIFERYWQAERGSRGGVGLGLAIVRGIIEAHGGAVGVESRVGEGSTFRFTIPVMPDSSAIEHTASSA